MPKYSIVAEDICVEGINCTTYGIRAESNEMSTAEFHDVSVEKSFVDYVVDLLNSNQVELCHFHDVVIDELNR